MVACCTREYNVLKAEEFERIYRVEEDHWWYRALHALLLDFVKRHAPDTPLRILDIGCGTGAVMDRLAGRGTTFGIDPEPEAVVCCRRRGLPKMARASADALPFPDECFDAGVMLDVLTQSALYDKTAPLREARRVLKSGGLLFLNVPAYQCLYSSHDRAIQADRRLNRGEVVRLLHDAGFQVRRVTYWNTVLFPAMAALRLWRKRQPYRGSDLQDVPPAIVNKLLTGLLTAERRVLRTVSLPFGLSVFAVAIRR